MKLLIYKKFDLRWVFAVKSWNYIYHQYLVPQQLHEYTIYVLEPVISTLDKQHHLLWVTTINYSQLGNPPQPSLVLVNHAKSCYTFGSPKLQLCNTVWPILIIFIFPFPLLPLFLVSQREHGVLLQQKDEKS